MIEVTVLFPNGTFSSTAVGPMEVFRHAGVLWNTLSGQPSAARFRVTTASLDGRAVRCDGPLTIKPAMSISEVRAADLIFVPSTGESLDDAVERNPAAIPWLRRWHRRGAAIAAVCSGVSLVAAAGLLDGKRATTHWGLAERFQQLYPRVHWTPEYLVTEDNGIYCGGGVNASFDLSLFLVERFCGHEVAVQTAKALLIETPRTWQTGFAAVPLKTQHHDDAIRRAQDWMHESFQKEISSDTLAERLAMSPRNFVRRFKAATSETPLGYQQKLRISAAKRLLESDYRTVQEVCGAVGYQDAAFFREIFKRQAGVSPQAYRRRFGLRRNGDSGR